VAGPIPGVGITAPGTVQPENGTKIRADLQPLTLTVTNSTSNGVRPLSYRFEVAADANFTTMLFMRDSIAPGDGGQTNLRLPDALAPDHTYYWRARAEDGANVSSYSNPAAFNVVTPVTFGAPTLVSPINNVVASSLRPVFTWNNAPRSGGAPENMAYLIELSDTAAFTQTVSATVGEGAGQTSVAPPQDLPAGRQGFWRVRAFDATTTGPWSATGVFQTPAAAPTPSPGPGGGGAGCNWPGSPANWSTAQWHDCFFSMIAAKGVGNQVTFGAMATLRPDLNALGAEWQNGWRGDYRPRLFLPVPGCPGNAISPTAPDCAYNRTVDVEANGVWAWIVR
jgi:hypothetical protein